MRKILTLLGGLLSFAVGANAALTSVSLAWNPSTSQNVAGYEIYYGTSSGNYDTAVPVSNVTNVSINGLTNGTTYYFAATSYDSNGNESPFSPEIAAVAGGTGQFGVAVTSLAGSQYIVQDSKDMVNWDTLKANMQTNGLPFNFVEYLNNNSLRVTVSVVPVHPPRYRPPGIP